MKRIIYILVLTLLVAVPAMAQAPRDTFSLSVDSTDAVYQMEKEGMQLYKKGEKQEAGKILLRVYEIKDSLYDARMSRLINEAYDRMQVEEKIEAEHHRTQKVREVVLKVIATSLIIIALILFFVIINMHRMAGKLRQNNAELEETRKQLEAANKETTVSLRQKDEFIRHISHEVRTPLNIIGGFAQILGMVDALPEDGMKEINQKLTASSKNITNIMKNITALSDMEQHKPIERSDRMTCRELCEKAIAESEIQDNKKIRFTFNDPAPEGLSIRTSAMAVESILTELLNNAQRFTGDGEVELTYSLPGHRLVFFTVTDNGAPIPEKETEHIFEAFVKLNDFDEGIGGGLTVARSMAKRIEGNVWLDTSYKEGNRFVVELKV